MNSKDIELYKSFQASPILFIEKMWGLIPQPLKKEYQEKAKTTGLDEFKVHWFEPFIKGRHITWQQWLGLLAIEKALRGEDTKRISIRSGHGVGKSATLAWLILWYLFCFKNAQVPCTAPTSEQMHDILWKELSLWLNRMPDEIQEKYDWTTGYLRITESPATWFARARTARKENPEALAGVHGDYVMFIIDEASGIPQEIFNTAEGALTGKDILVVMISNHTRLIGYFHDSHNSDKYSWQRFTFDSRESPLVDDSFVRRIADKHGEESDEFRIRVMGLPPKEDTVDDKGYVPLLVENDLKETVDSNFVGKKRMGIDPSGEGNNETSWTIRDKFKMKVVAKKKISTGKSIAQKTLTLMDYYGFKKKNAKKEITLDGFGLGVEATQELALAGVEVYAVNVGEQPELDEDKKLYLNIRAMAYDRYKKWLRSGGELVKHQDWKKLLIIRYRRELSGKMKIMSKREMKKEGLGSPDTPDAGMLTFIKKEEEEEKKKYKQKAYTPTSEFEGRK